MSQIEAALREALTELDERFRACFGLPISAEEAYDSFYQEIVAAALSQQSPAPSPEPLTQDEWPRDPRFDAWWGRLEHLGPSEWYEGMTENIARYAWNSAKADASPAPSVEPAGWVNGNELDNMLDDRTATIAGRKDGWRQVPLYRASREGI